MLRLSVPLAEKKLILPTTLYLIPTPIAENTLHTLPAYATAIVRELDVFIVVTGVVFNTLTKQK